MGKQQSSDKDDKDNDKEDDHKEDNDNNNEDKTTMQGRVQSRAYCHSLN